MAIISDFGVEGFEQRCHGITRLLGQLAEVSEGSDGLERRLAAGTFGCNSCHLECGKKSRNDRVFAHQFVS